MKFCMKCMAQYEDGFTICPVCGFKEGTLPTDSRCMEPGQVLADRYIVGMPLSIDSWTVKYIGWDALTERKVRINEYFPTRYAAREMGKIPLTVVKQKSFYKYMNILLKKAQLLAETHLPDNICSIHESFEKNNTAYVITELIDGKPLAQHISEEAPMTMNSVEKLFLPVIRSLDKLHENGYVSGGFSPDSFMLTAENSLVFSDYLTNLFFNVTDEGAERKREDSDRYYPPERMDDSDTIDISPENDVFSCAVIMYEMLGAKLPSQAERREIYEKKHRDILKKPSAYGAKIEKTKENALINAAAVDPAKRTPDMETFLKELQSDSPVMLRSKQGKKFPLWAKIGIPVLSAAVIAGAAFGINALVNGGHTTTTDVMAEGQTIVPSVVNYSLSEATEELKKNGLLIEIEGKKTDDGKEENLVLSQSTDKGSIVSENTVIGVTVNAHSGEFTMPNFLGIDLRECTQVLDNIGMNYSITKEYHSVICSNCVISQSIAPYSKVMANQKVDIVVSQGAEPEKNDPDVLTKTDDLTGMPYESVLENPKEDSATVQVTDRVYDDSKPEGTIIEQSPAAGTEQKADEPVKVVVSTANASVVVPDVTFLDDERAKQLLEYYGLKCESEMNENDTAAHGLIVSQEPAGGNAAAVGDTVKISVSKGKETVSVPDTVGSSSNDAMQKMIDSGLSVRFTYETDTGKAEDTVLKQSIEPGSEAKKGSEIILTVNSAKQVSEVPDIIGLEVDEADKIVTEAGFNLLIYAGEENPYTTGTIFAQGPKAGLFAASGEDIVVLLSGSEEERSKNTEPELNISADEITIGLNEEFTLEIDLSNIKDLSAVEYEVGDPAVTDVVHIDKNTLAMTFKGHSEGRTEITILCGNLSRKCTVTVNAESDPVKHDERR